MASKRFIRRFMDRDELVRNLHLDIFDVRMQIFCASCQIADVSLNILPIFPSIARFCENY